MKLLFIRKKSLFILPIFILTIIIYSFHFQTLTYTFSDNFQNGYEYEVPRLINGKEKVAYLTFDDGPTLSVTPKILDILEEENIKATFFVIGKKVDEHPEIVRREYELGHYIANHTYSHDNAFLYSDSKNFINEINKTDLAIGNAIGDEEYCSHVFRFPNGFMSSLYKSQKKAYLPILEDMDYTYIDWNCLTNDSMKKYSNFELLQNLKESCKRKDTLVVLMHDTKDVNDSSLVLKDCIKFLKEQGYTFKNLYEFIDN